MRAAFALTSLLTATSAEAAPLTYAAALQIATGSAPAVEARALAVRAAQSASRAAGALPDPKVSVGVNDFPISGPLAGRPRLDNFSMVTFGYSQDVPNTAKRQARSERARTDISAAEAEVVVAQRKVRVATALAWVDAYYAERRLAALDDISKEIETEVQTAPAQLASGSIRPALALVPRQAVANLDDRRAALVAELAKAHAQLLRWVGGDDPVSTAGSPPSDSVDPVRLRAGLDGLPDLRLAAASILQAQAAANEAKAEKRPDWGYEIQYSHRDPLFGDYISGKVTFSLPIFAKTRQDPVIEARLADVNRSAVEREDTRRELKADLDGGLADHVMHHEQLERARETLIPLARQQSRLELASYAAGSATLAEVLNSVRALIEARLSALDLEAQTVRDGARLNLTYGSDDQ